ncbi:MAG: site-specific integrase [Clostridiales bacterium]|nr:site-specific integrase [Clostridiales bacterium]
MGRKTVYNNITTPELIERINPENTELMNDFLDYLSSVKRSERTISGYKSDLEIFFVWNLQNNKNKFFVELTKREVAKFQKHCLEDWGWSTNRLARVKSALSSMSNYIENILDDEIEGYRPIIRKIETPIKENIREKTIISDEEVDRVLDELVAKGKYQMATALALAANCGCRISELLRFKVSYFDDSNLVFDGALYKTPEQIKTKGRSGGKMLTKYIFVDFKKYFDLWMNYRKEKGIDSEWLFIKESTKEQMRLSQLYSYADILSEMFGKPFYFHSLRHYLCTRMRHYNLPSNIIKEFFGWSNLEMIEIYDDTDASEEFGKYFTKDGIVAAKEGSLTDMD